MNLQLFVEITGTLPCIMNNAIGIPQEALDRFIGRISPDPQTACWVWTGWQQAGYGAFQFKPGENARKTWKVHRLSYYLAHGPVELGYQLHHVCQNKLCCNPAHLECLTPTEHGLEEKRLRPLSVECKRGHTFTPENSIIQKDGKRQCRTCVLLRHKEIYRAVNPLPKAVTHCKHGHEFTEENTYYYTTPVGGNGRGCRICRNRNRHEGTIKKRQEMADKLHLVKPTTTHCFNGHCYEKVGWSVQHTGTIRCRQCVRDVVNRKNAIKRKDAVPKTHCVKGHDLAIYGYKSPRGEFRIICRVCFGHKKKNLLPDGTLNFGGRIDPNAQPRTNETSREVE